MVFGACFCVVGALSAAGEGIDLSRIPSPQILPFRDGMHFRDPAAVFHDGTFHLFFTVTVPRHERKSMVSFLGKSTSADLMRWSDVNLLTPEDPALNYSSPGNVIRFNDEWIICLQTYPILGEGFIGDKTARLFIMRSKDLEHWSASELLRVKGPDVPRKMMGRMIDAYLVEDEGDPGKWWCFYKQNGVSMSYSRDLETWTYAGHREAGENVCVIVRDDTYYLIHSPGHDGMGLMTSKELKNWRPALKENITLGYQKWPWAQCRLTAGFVLDMTKYPDAEKYLMFYHATQSCEPHEHIGGCSIGIAWSDDLLHWDWPGKTDN